METRSIHVNTPEAREDALREAVRTWREGGLVAVPTETVYGLAGDALNPMAVAAIFQAKQRPSFNPLIVHLPDPGWVERLTLPGAVSPVARRLMDEFWPGPLTFLFPADPVVPDLVRAGLPTVAVRYSGHPLFHDLIQAFGKPLAAPSANRFGRITPTTGKAALDELRGRIPLVIDDGPTDHGLESTIVRVTASKIEILRHGPVPREILSQYASVTEIQPALVETQPHAPGQLKSHYAPETPLQVVEPGQWPEAIEKCRAGLLAWNPPPAGHPFAQVELLSTKHDFREAAANLFRALRRLDQAGLDLLIAERLPRSGLGVAMNDRLQRAAIPGSPYDPDAIHTGQG